MEASSGNIMQLLEEMKLPVTLQQRLHVTVNGATSRSSQDSFVLYLPTVVLRRKHNGALALACRVANHLQLPLFILCTVLDDAHLPISKELPHVDTAAPVLPPVTVATARRFTFYLQALQGASQEWESLGASIFIRVHHPTARKPHHLTMSRHAACVVSDEPFVHPFLQYIQTVERACRSCPNTIPCIRVDSSTTVPPIAVLKHNDGSDVPTKAWMWMKLTQFKRKGQIHGVVKEGHLDAPEVQSATSTELILNDLKWKSFLPSEWFDDSNTAPDIKPWSVGQFIAVDVNDFVQNWPGVDNTVPACVQTHGRRGWERWKRFQAQALAQYARRRNDVSQPHSVSRLSCYLNIGSISIFDIVHDLFQDTSRDTTKFQDEVIKWREFSYVHCFAHSTNYFTMQVLPKWSQNYLVEHQQMHNRTQTYSLTQLAEARTNDEKWNAMQQYLIDTGELHNNARMTWGKTVVHWQKSDASIMLQMAFVNDRYALDGLSPPSYAGLLWCLGWADKQASGGGITEKPASRYKADAKVFRHAKDLLLRQNIECLFPNTATTVVQQEEPAQKRPKVAKVSPSADCKSCRAQKKNTIMSYFQTSANSP